VDSSSKMVDGILSGSMTFLGIYDQCLNTTVPHPKMKEKVLFRGQYCLTEIRSPLPRKSRRYNLYDQVDELRNFSGTDVVKFLSTRAHFHYILPFRAGLCVPSGCTKNDLNQLLSIVSEKLLLNFHVSHCEVKKEEIKLTAIQIFAIIICCFLVTLVLLGTWLEIRTRGKENAYQHVGYRFLSCFSMITNFKRLASTKTSSNSLKCLHGLRFLSITWVVMGHCYFFPGWFIRSYRSLFFIEHVATEPIAQMIINGSEAVDTFFFMSGLLCMVHTWYVSCDFQLYLASLIVIFPLLKSEKIGIAVNILIIVISIIYSGIITYIGKIIPTVIMTQPDPIDRNLGYLYTYGNTLSRAGPYFIGILTGYLLIKYPEVKIPKTFQVIGWCLATLSSGLVVFITGAWYKIRPPSPLEVLLYATFYKVAFTIGVAWLTFCCITGRGGILNDFLSWKVWVPLSKLTFLIYLIQPIFQTLFIANFKSTQEYSHLFFIIQFFGFLCISSLLAMICNLLVESPFLSLEKLLLKADNGKKEMDVDTYKVSDGLNAIKMNGKRNETKLENCSENLAFDSKL
ncbi:nose resistant to fluoxetine protein 6, partial [Nephila pilipes]